MISRKRGALAPIHTPEMAPPDDMELYDAYIERMRMNEYPMLKDSIYLDHAGTTLYSKTHMERFHRDMMANLYGNPHSASLSSQHSTQMVESVRLDLLRYLGADPDYFDLVFTANATAGIKLVMDAFREHDGGFWYGYHIDSHTSLVGVREVAKSHKCFAADGEVEAWLNEDSCNNGSQLGLFAYPAQSNMNGRRLTLSWCERVRLGSGSYTYSLLDAAALASTASLDLSDSDIAPDFTVLSLYKIFGFPDLGALIVRKDSGSVFQKRKYFGGGTVDIVLCTKEQWHSRKSEALHEQLEDGTLPVHSILALKSAMSTHKELFSTLDRVSRHTAALAKELHDGLIAMKHANDRPVCTMYRHDSSTYGDATTQGPLVAINLRNSNGDWVSNTEVEKLATIKDIHLRTGGLCNPGGIASSLGLQPWEMRENFSAGHRCGGEDDIRNGKPTGMIRVSLGAMSTRSDVDRFLAFVNEFFVDKNAGRSRTSSLIAVSDPDSSRFHVESLTVYPIKSCAGWQIPHDISWEVREEGLAWDREWCVVHSGTGSALSQKRYPRMALIRPSLDFRAGRLVVRQVGSTQDISVPLSMDPSYFAADSFRDHDASVCGDQISAREYTSPDIAAFFTNAIGVPCTLARFPAATAASQSVRHSKLHLQQSVRSPAVPRSILLSNESPILTISRSSLNRLNEQIKAKGGKAAHPSVFRANIILAESPLLPPGREQPWAEDELQSMQIGGRDGPLLDFLGGCRRCQMVCVDQESAEKNQEPFVTLAKTRRFDGRVLFGVHTALSAAHGSRHATIRAGDLVETRISEQGM